MDKKQYLVHLEDGKQTNWVNKEYVDRITKERDDLLEAAKEYLGSTAHIQQIPLWVIQKFEKAINNVKKESNG